MFLRVFLLASRTLQIEYVDCFNLLLYEGKKICLESEQELLTQHMNI